MKVTSRNRGDAAKVAVNQIEDSLSVFETDDDRVKLSGRERKEREVPGSNSPGGDPSEMRRSVESRSQCP